jgi:hypothetical protein
VDRAAQLLEVAAVHVGHLGLDHGEDLGQHLEHGHLGSQLAEEGGELHPHDAAADDDQPLRQLLELEDCGGVDRVLDAFDRDPRRHRAGGEDDVAGRDLLFANGQAAFAEEPRGAGNRLDAGGLEERPDTVHEGVHDLGLALHGRREIEGQALYVDAELGAPAGEREHLG